MSQAGIVDFIGTHPEIPTMFVANVGTAIPIANTIEILGEAVTAHGVPLQTVASGNTININVQYASAAASSVAANAGVASFDSTDFIVDANGFVSLTAVAGATQMGVDTFTAPGTNPVMPNVSGIITVTGGQVAAGTTSNVIRTDSLAANTYTIQIQRSQAVGSSTVGDNGVSHFNSTYFTVDANGFVSLVASAVAASFTVDAFTAPGTNPVVPNGSGNITITGGQVAAGTTTSVIRTDSLAANSYTIQIQRSSSQATSTVGANGVSHFNSTFFTVDGNGFVSASATGLGQTITGNSGGPLSPTSGNWNIIGSKASTGNTVMFLGSVSTLTLKASDSNANTFFGDSSGGTTTSGTANTGFGTSVLTSITTSASSNSAFGSNSLGNLITGSSNVAMNGGASYTSTESSNIVILNTGTIGDSNTIRIGTQGSGGGQQNKAFIAGIVGVTTTNTQMVTINSSTGQLGAATVPSGVVTINGDTGSATGTTITETGVNSGSSVRFSATGSTVSLNVTDASFNTIIGNAAGNLTLSGSSNVSLGRVTFFGLTTGSNNTCIGDASSVGITTGTQNVSVGSQNLKNLLTGSSNVSIGYLSGNSYTGSEASNILITSTGTTGESNVIRIGTQGSGSQQQNKCFIAGIAGVTVANTTIVTQNSSTTQMGTIPYVEGTYTPVLAFNSASVGITYTTQLGRYTQIGNVVYFSIEIILSSKGSSTGAASISLPIGNGGGTISSAAAAIFNGVTLSASYNWVGASVQSSALVLTESSTVAGAPNSAILDSMLSNTFAILMNGFYYTN